MIKLFELLIKLFKLLINLFKMMLKSSRPQYYTHIGLRYVCYLKIFDKNKRKSNLLGIKFQKYASPNFVSLALVGANVNASKHKQKYIYL